MAVPPKSLAALDVGARRIGISVASIEARLPRPLITLQFDDTFFPTLQSIVEVEGIKLLVVGFPRGMRGQITAQTTAIEEFTKELKRHFAMPVHFQDESLTSKRAEEELKARGRLYDKGDVDALAATYILEDFVNEHQDLSSMVEMEV